MNRKATVLMLGVAAMLASCSEDELQDRVNNNEGLKPATITATLPADGMVSRVTDDAAAARCYVQVLKGDGTELDGGNSVPKRMEPAAGGGYTTTVYLKEGATYNFLYWADTKGTDAAAPTDLTAVAYENGETNAWAGTSPDVTWSEDGVVEATLKHIVTRVTVVNRESIVTVSDSWPLTITLEKTYNTYNVATGEATGEAAYEFEAANGDYEANAEVGYFYVLGNKQNQKLALHYAGPLGNSPIYINNFPVLPDYHITLSGDIKNAGLILGTINATVVDEWGKYWTVQFLNE